MSISSPLHKPIFYKIQAASTGNIQEEKTRNISAGL